MFKWRGAISVLALYMILVFLPNKHFFIAIFFHVNQLMLTKCIFTQISLLITSLYSTNFWVIFHPSSLFKLDLLELITATLPQTPEFIADGVHLLG